VHGIMLYLISCLTGVLQALTRMKVFNTGFPKINFAFLLVIVIVLGNVIFNYYIIRKSKDSISEMTGVINPYIEALAELNLMVTESKMYATNWVYLQNSIEDKEKLQELHRRRYKELKNRIQFLTGKRQSSTDAGKLARVFAKFNELINVETEIMSTLVTFDDYENPSKKFKCEDIIESEVLPRTQEIMGLLGVIIEGNRAEARSLTDNIQKNAWQMMAVMLVVACGLLFFILVAVSFISRGIRGPVESMKVIINRLSRGEIIHEELHGGDNAVGEMVSSVNALSTSFTKTSQFATEIGKGNLSVPYEKLSEDDVLGNALISMQNSLRAYSEDMEEKVRERTEEVIEKGRKLESAYREIRDSINYAKRIQESILPSNEMIEAVFANSFIFYKPKDVVCGDFYWFNKKDNDVVIAAVDCTGHGVPGALMTVIGNSLLNQIITFSGITRPSEILYQLDKKLHDTLRQHGGSATNDGMDMSVCHYNIATNTITYAGAKRPLYLMRNNKLTEIKGSRAPIGSYIQDLEKEFEDHEIQVQKNDTLYIFSDGVQDQFGGYEGKKYMISRLRELLYEIQVLTMQQQKERIEKELAQWQKEFEQTDDMLLIGMRF
jgi:serine phosphatase RsbU (regulator of sigma subunit)